jgi:hypothetical protein
MNRRYFISRFFIATAVPLVPLLSLDKTNPGTIVFLEESVVDAVFQPGFMWRALAACDGKYASVVVATYEDPRRNHDVASLVRKDAQKQLKRYFRRTWRDA